MARPEYLPTGTIDLRRSNVDAEFVLRSAAGPVNLDRYRGKVVLIYFGYTFCPDVCPTNLAIMSAAFGLLTEAELQEVQGIFISVDPERDSLERLTQYTGFFHPRIVGLTGDPATLAEIAKRYGAVYQRSTAQSAGGYLVDHSSYVYVVNPEGDLDYALPHAAPPEVIARVVRDYVAGTSL